MRNGLEAIFPNWKVGRENLPTFCTGTKKFRGLQDFVGFGVKRDDLLVTFHASSAVPP
jgi:hypothetical protein